VDLEVFGTGLERFTDGFTESLDVLLATLSGRPTVRADGRLHRFREVPVVPRPARPVPIWVAATSASTVEACARRGVSLLLGMHDDDAAKAALLDRYAKVAAEVGHDPGGVAHASAHLAYVADSVEAAERALRAPLAEWLGRTREYVRLDGQPSERDLDAYLERLLAVHPVGPPRRCVERLNATLAATGASRLLLMVEGAGDPDLTLDTIARLGAEVLPALRRRPVTLTARRPPAASRPAPPAAAPCAARRGAASPG
jgi:alkanesulfonate monooxygenase SsuD/methylene tetrahydromethanopterin reductase-like flavin-dependent oxidoreductase (luciferase family)